MVFLLTCVSVCSLIAWHLAAFRPEGEKKLSSCLMSETIYDSTWQVELYSVSGVIMRKVGLPLQQKHKVAMSKISEKLSISTHALKARPFLHTVHWRSSDSVAELEIKTHAEMHDSADAVLTVADVRGTCQFNIMQCCDSCDSFKSPKTTLRTAVLRHFVCAVYCYPDSLADFTDHGPTPCRTCLHPRALCPLAGSRAWQTWSSTRSVCASRRRGTWQKSRLRRALHTQYAMLCPAVTIRCWPPQSRIIGQHRCRKAIRR